MRCKYAWAGVPAIEAQQCTPGGLFNLTFEPLNAHSYTHLHHGSQVIYTGWLYSKNCLSGEVLAQCNWVLVVRGGWTLCNNLEMSHDEQFITHIVFNKTI